MNFLDKYLKAAENADFMVSRSLMYALLNLPESLGDGVYELPLPKTGMIIYGVEPGEKCNRPFASHPDVCTGVIEAPGDCECSAVRAPCGKCETGYLQCPVCGIDKEHPEFYTQPKTKEQKMPKNKDEAYVVIMGSKIKRFRTLEKAEKYANKRITMSILKGKPTKAVICKPAITAQPAGLVNFVPIVGVASTAPRP